MQEVITQAAVDDAGSASDFNAVTLAGSDKKTILEKLREARILLNTFLRGWSYFRGDEVSVGYPTITSLEPTNFCPMSCRMCPRTDYMSRKIGYMDFELYKKIIDQCKGYTQYLGIQLFGDSVFHPKIWDMVDYAEERGIKIMISTNPTSINAQKADAILNSKLSNLVLSMEGTNDETYKFYRGPRANYELAIKNIDYLCKQKVVRGQKYPAITIRMIKMKLTALEFDAFKKQWTNFPGIDEVTIKNFSTYGGMYSGINESASEDQKSSRFKQPNTYPCRDPWVNLTVLWDGRVVPCCIDVDGYNVVGDLRTQTIEEIWNGLKMRELRRQHITGKYGDNKFCKYCRERRGYQPSKFYPLNKFVLKRIGKIYDLVINKHSIG